MGNVASSIASASNNAVKSVTGRKRKYIEEDKFDTDCRIIDETMQTPKRRKLLCTAQYIYKTLFKEEKGSDITVMMLGRAWRLHKVYISQSPYFASMFSGLWKESNDSVINVEITDPLITHESLSTVLGSFYQDEVSIEPKDVISILATATLFQLQGLIDECTSSMTETINIKTVVPYFNAAISYGVPKVRSACKRWLEVNLVGYCWLYPSFLKELSPELMSELISSPTLVALQTEFCIYMMLRVWLFIQVQNKNDTFPDMEEFYNSPTWKKPFLENEGSEYAEPFKALRMKYLLLHNHDVKILQTDNLIPESWLHEAYKEQWLHLLNIDANKDMGPKSMSQEEFSQECFRCGRCIEHSGEHVWRWTAFHFGLDLVLTLDLTTLKLKRFHKQDNHIKANHNKHNVMIRVSLISLNEQRQVKFTQDSGLMRLLLHKNEEKQIMCLESELTYPLYVSVNMQVVTPFTATAETDKTETSTIIDLSNF